MIFAEINEDAVAVLCCERCKYPVVTTAVMAGSLGTHVAISCVICDKCTRFFQRMLTGFMELDDRETEFVGFITSKESEQEDRGEAPPDPSSN